MAAPEKHEARKLITGNICILLATIFWGVNYAFTKALIPDFMSAEGVAAARLLGGCALFWLASLFVKRERIAREDMKKAAIGGFVGLFGCVYFCVLALDYGSPIDISIIMTLPPVFVILMEVIFMHNRPSLLEYLGMAVSFAGAAFIILGRAKGGDAGSNLLLGDVFGLLSALSFAIYLVVLAKPTGKYHPISLLRWVFLFGAIPGVFISRSLIDMPLLHTAQAAPWLEIGFIVIGPTFLAYLLTQPAIRDIGSVLVSLYQYLIPMVAAWTSIAMGLDSLRWQQAAAMLVVIAGMILTNIGKRRAKTTA